VLSRENAHLLTPGKDLEAEVVAGTKGALGHVGKLVKIGITGLNLFHGDPLQRRPQTLGFPGLCRFGDGQSLFGVGQRRA
jgi:hypothetical protein